jgi:hypothetical protein
MNESESDDDLSFLVLWEVQPDDQAGGVFLLIRTRAGIVLVLIVRAELEMLAQGKEAARIRASDRRL